MVMAAGLGSRMRPITDQLPKPLVSIGGRTMLDHALDRLKAAGIRRVVVNVHHLADQVEAALAARLDLDVAISDERAALLETGGGLLRAMPLLGPGTERSGILVMNSDSLWTEGAHANMDALLEAWDPAAMDLLLMCAPIGATLGYEGRGDFSRDDDGRLARRGARASVPYVYAGVAMVRAALLAPPSPPLPDGPFSLNVLFDRAIAAGRLYGTVMEGEWLHVGTPESIAPAEARIRAAAVAAKAAMPSTLEPA